MHRRHLLALAAASLALPPAARAEPLADQPPLPAPLGRYRHLPVRRLDGEPRTLGALLGPQRPTILSFWATWCAPCALEGRRLARLRSRYPDERLAILGLNIDSIVEPARLDRFRRRAEMNYTQALDAKAAYIEIAGRSQLALPRTYVFDAEGRPIAAFGRFFGERTLVAIEDAAARVVAAT